MFFKKKPQQPSFVSLVSTYVALDEVVASRIKTESQKLVKDLVSDGVQLRNIGGAIKRPKSYIAGVFNGTRYLTPKQFLTVVEFAARGAK